MVTRDDDTGTAVQQRTARLRPPGFWRTWLIGRPLPTAAAPHQTIGKAIGLAVFASDALSSTAYATQEILFILAAAGMMAFGYAFPIAIAIAGLLAIVTLSYEQTVHAYPDGGGAYIVSRDNLGTLWASIAGVSLLIDYILTVAVSVSAGVAQITSASRVLSPYRVYLAIGLVLFVMVINLRGVKESGATFAIPTYFFLAVMFLMVGLGLIHYLDGTLGAVVDPPHLEVPPVLQVVTPFVILHAFASGTAALTGVEAISNGITAFKEPRSRNAGITLICMAAILGTLFVGITFLAVQIGATPSEEETVISQLARTAFAGQGVLYLATIAATTAILILATNTAFADFPRLSAILAGDGLLPRHFNYRGSRLVFSRGIIALAVIAALLIVLFRASVTALIPLYAIGVFLSFTLSRWASTASGGCAPWWSCWSSLSPSFRTGPGSSWSSCPRSSTCLAPSIVIIGCSPRSCRWTTLRRPDAACATGSLCRLAGCTAGRPRRYAMPTCSPTTSPRCTCRSTLRRLSASASDGRCGARASDW